MPEPLPNTPKEQPASDGLEMMCTGILRTEFGRKPTEAVSKAMARLAAEETVEVGADSVAHTLIEPGSAGIPAGKVHPNTYPAAWVSRFREWLSELSLGTGIAAGAAAVLVAVLAIWFLAPDRLLGIKRISASATVCTVSDSLAPHWTGSARPQAGNALKRGAFQLESGAVELTFLSKARVAIEGPARFKLTDGNSMELEAGRISAEVPRQARGFAVKTPNANLVDLGTRFGASVGSNGKTELDVFQGRVELTAGAGKQAGKWRLTPGMAMVADSQGAVTSSPAPEATFPQPGQVVLARPQNCGFDALTAFRLGDIPTQAGYWRGPAYSLVARTREIRPYEGAGMLQFMAPAAGGDSEVWQIVSMRPFKSFLSEGNVEAWLSAYFNRLPCDASAGEKFGLTLAAFHGDPADAGSLWASRVTSSLAQAEKQLTADNNPATWEEIQISASLPADTDFVVISLKAVAPNTTTASTLLFPGHLADLVDLKLCSRMKASSVAKR